MQKNQLTVLQKHLERYCNVLPVYGFNSAKYDINSIKSYLLPILINEKNMEPVVIKKANQFVSFKIGDVQLLDIMNFLGGATNLGSFLRAYKTEEAKGFFRMKGSTVHKRWITVSFPLTTHFSANFETWTTLKKTIQFIKIYLAADWNLKKHYPKWSFPNHQLQEKKTTNICLIYGIMKIYARLKFFTLVQQQRRCPNSRSDAKNACFLSQERNWHAEARVYTSEVGEYLSPQIYQRQILSIHWNR